MVERLAAAINSHEFPGLFVGQWFQQHAVYDGKERGIRANSKGQGKNSNGGESAAIRKHAKCVPDVLPEVGHRIPRGTPILKDGLLPVDTAAPCFLFRRELEVRRCFSSRRYARF